MEQNSQSMGGLSNGQPVKIIMIVVVIAVIAIAVYVLWAKFYRAPSTVLQASSTPRASVSASPAPSSLGNQIYSQPQNIINKALPKTNPF